MSLERFALRKTGDLRYVEDRGLYFEDFEIGLVIEHRPGRTITASDTTWGALLAMNQHPIHINADYAEKTEFGKLLVCGLTTFNIVNGMSVVSVSQRAIASLGWEKVRLTAPVFIGDTLYAESKVVSARPSKSRPGQGIVTVETTGRNQDRSEVVRFERTILVPFRGDPGD